MFADSEINQQAWWYTLRKWREAGKLRPNEHYITETKTKGRLYKYLRRPVLNLILDEFPKSHFSRTILLYYREEIEKALSTPPTAATTDSDQPENI